MSKNGLKIIIVGAGKIARTIVAQLVEEGHDLTIVDVSYDVVEEFTQAYDCMGVVGNGATYATLKEAGIASTLMALTPIIIILPSYWLFQQKITWKAVVGAFISVIGVSLFFLG